MRKLLLFLVLLGAGVSVLVWLEHGAQPKTKEGEEAPTPRRVPPALDLEPGVSLGGRFSGTFYDPETNRAVLRIESDDSGTRGREDILVDVRVELLDPRVEPAKIQATVKARRARIRRTGENPEFEPRHEPRAYLEDVEAQFLAGLPIVPLTVETDAAVIDATDPAARALSSDRPVEIRSARLVGRGDGFVCDVDGEVTELEDRGWIEFLENGETTVRFSSLEKGPLLIHREKGEETRPVRIEAWEGAQLEILGESGSTLSAEHVLARGVESAGAGNVFRIQTLEADGEVVWTYGDNEFRGKRASMTFDDDGELLRAQLEGPPTSAKLLLDADEPALENVPAGDVGTVRVFGNEKIDIRREERTDFDVDGPATVEAQGFRLRSNGALHGWLARDGRSAHFEASGGVVLEGEDATVETAEFELGLARAPDGKETLTGVAKGGARLVGTLDDGRTFTASTPDRLEVLRLAGSLHVVEGSNVDLAVDDPDGFRARADRVFDVDFARFAFRAEGNVEIDAKGGKGHGERLVATGPGRYTLKGTPEKRARLETGDGWAEAVEVEADGDRIHAKGNVDADLTTGSEVVDLARPAYQRYRLSGDDLVLVRSDVPDPEGKSSERTFDITVAGGVHARVNAGGESTELDCTRLTGHRVERFSGVGQGRAWTRRSTELVATGPVAGHLALKTGELDLSCDQLSITGEERPGVEEVQTAVASGNVRFEGTSEIDFRGEGEVLTLDSNRVGSLVGSRGERVRLAGILPSHGLPFRLNAKRIDFAADEIGAEDPEIRVGTNRARGKHMLASPAYLELSGDVRVFGTTKNEQPWTLDAQLVRFEGRPAVDPSRAELKGIDASGGVTFRLGTLVVARGDELTAEAVTGRMRITGKPARVQVASMEYEADWIEFDKELQIILATGKGRIRPGVTPGAKSNGTIGSDGQGPLQEEEEDDWGLRFLSSSTLVEPDSLIYVLQEPEFHYRYAGFRSTTRASWTVLWIDRLKWQQLPERLEREEQAGAPAEPEREVLGPMGDFFHFLQKQGIEGLVREAYFEGPVDVLTGEDLVAHADAIYLDLAEGKGWLANATVNILGKLVGQDFKQIIVKADWLQHAKDGSLVADDATVTPCDFEKPHVRIVTGDLRLKPLPPSRAGGVSDRFRLDVKDNRVELYNLPRIPLPPISIDTDEKLRPFWPSLAVGNSARLGSFLRLNVSGSSEAAADLADSVLPSESEDRETVKKEPTFDANYTLDAQYLGSRGGLLDIGMELKSKKRYWFELYTGLVYDTGEDKGYVRVPEGERNALRRWIRSLNTVQLEKDRITLAYSDQGDPGVQSEFWEGDFVRYEQDETYLQWNRTSGNTYTQATAKARVDAFRSDVDELPSVSTFRGRAPLFHLGKYPVLHTGDAGFAYLKRHEGEDPTSPFGLPATFPDGLGERESLRFDTNQELEVPVPLGLLGLKLVPFTGIAATAWSEAVDRDKSASRFVADAGVRLATTFWKRRSNGTLHHQVTPYVEYRNDFVSEESEVPVVFSPVETRVFGNVIEVGTRARLGIDAGRSAFDLDLRGMYAADRTDGQPDGWLPIEVFGRLDVSPLGQLLEIWHDARYDVEQGKTVYSLLAIGSRGGADLERLGWQVSHQRGLDSLGDPLFETASVAGFFRWTEKWEFEGGQFFSLLENQGLGFRLTARRYGHDMVFEVETSFREGEGSSLGFSFSPRLGRTPSRIGYLNW